MTAMMASGRVGAVLMSPKLDLINGFFPSVNSAKKVINNHISDALEECDAHRR